MICFNCCLQVTPRYKRLVDNIFPANLQEGLDKSNMEKLMFYALSSPEKLDRIGEYLYLRISRDIARKRNVHVKIAMEAMDQLLIACHSQRINLFVESYLRMVQKLMECREPDSQILATQSFVRFANIEEDTPSYHRRYDFFVSKFSSMCHNNSYNNDIRNKIRLAGVKGLQGVIRKTVSDDLVENIWEPVHMDKIIPSLLYNMQNPSFKVNDQSFPDLELRDIIFTRSESEERDPGALAESCFRELIGKASFGHVKSIIRPVLRHFDLHNLWISKSFAIHCFRMIMFSIQSQYLYIVVESLMVHLDENSKLPPKIRTNVADVLSKIIAIAASESVGPTVLEIINSLLTHLRTSVTRQNIYSNPVNEAIDEEENQYQEALIVALGEFAANLPDYQKTEIMMFIMSKITHAKPSDSSSVHNRIQNIYLKSLLMVCSKYNSPQVSLPQSFLDPLIRLSRDEDPELRILVQSILHAIFDKDNIDGKQFNKTEANVTESNSDDASHHKHAVLLLHGHNWTENVPSSGGVDFSIEGHSNSSSPCLQRKQLLEDLSFEAMKRVSTENFDKYFVEQADRNEEILEKYRSLSFSELIQISTTDETDTITFKLNEIFSKITNDAEARKSIMKSDNFYNPGLETLFPECFVY